MLRNYIDNEDNPSVRLTAIRRELKKKFGYDIENHDLTHDCKGIALNGREEDFSFRRNFITNLRWGDMGGESEILYKIKPPSDFAPYSAWMKPIINDIFEMLGDDHPALTADKNGVNVWIDIKRKDW